MEKHQNRRFEDLNQKKPMIEKHLFASFIPNDCEILILGSFPERESTQTKRENDWFYGASKNQFWKILALVYNKVFTDINEKQDLLIKAKIGITDILTECERSENNNSDSNLTNKQYKLAIPNILSKYPINKILFTSKKVYDEFLCIFGLPSGIEMIVLPSPSPAFWRLSIHDKAIEYRKHVPILP